MTAIAERLRPRTTDLGDMVVARALPSRARRNIGPFVFFDHMGPAEFPPGKGLNVRSHPHIGLATITYLFEGEILHRDSLGCVQPIRPGAVNWMTAGRGIVHSEKVTEAVLASGQRLHGIQTWVALPLEHEEVAPRFEHYPADRIPEVAGDGSAARVILGEACGVSSPVRSESDALYVDIVLDAGAEVTVPYAEEIGIYVVEGAVTIEGEALAGREMGLLAPGGPGRLVAGNASRVIVFGGAGLDAPRTIWWNFVSSRRDRIEQARQDWAGGRFAGVPGETDFIPLPE